MSGITRLTGVSIKTGRPPLHDSGEAVDANCHPHVRGIRGGIITGDLDTPTVCVVLDRVEIRKKRGRLMPDMCVTNASSWTDIEGFVETWATRVRGCDAKPRSKAPPATKHGTWY